MAIVLQNSRYNLTIDSKTIIGVMGNDYENFLNSLNGDVYFLNKKNIVSGKKVSSLIDIDDANIIKLIKEFKISDTFLNKNTNELSHSEEKILKYLLMVISNKNIIIIDEPFMDLDLFYKKKIILLLNQLVKEKKTVILGSVNSNIIYELCKKVLFINANDYYYSDIKCFSNQKLLNKYDIDIPYLVEFVELAKKKNIKLKYSKDIRDLIKDVYRNVS